MDEDNNYSVYVHVNTINGKKYFGITCRKPEVRWGKNGAGYSTQTYFWRSIQKYGWENFEHIILFNNCSEEQACEIEKQLIAKYDTCDPGLGYNYEPGGKCQSYEARRKIGESETGKKHHYYGKHRSEETRRKISESLSGENHPCYGKHLSEETRHRISESEKGSSKPKNRQKSCKKVRCIETGVVYPSIAEAERSLGIHHSAINRVLHKKRQTAGSFHWEYVDNVVA